CSVHTFNTWLEDEVGPLIASPAFQKDGLLVVVFDENGSDSSCGRTTGTGCGGQVEAVLVSPFIVSAGYQQRGGDPRNFNGSYEHENILRLIAEGLRLPGYPGAAASAANMAEFFNASSVESSNAAANE